MISLSKSTSSLLASSLPLLSLACVTTRDAPLLEELEETPALLAASRDAAVVVVVLCPTLVVVFMVA